MSVQLRDETKYQLVFLNRMKTRAQAVVCFRPAREWRQTQWAMRWTRPLSSFVDDRYFRVLSFQPCATVRPRAPRLSDYNRQRPERVVSESIRSRLYSHRPGDRKSVV